MRQGNGRRARMAYSLLTGDLADSQQYNETLWIRQLLEGQGIDPNSGTADLSACTPVARALLAPRVAAARRGATRACRTTRTTPGWATSTTRTTRSAPSPPGRGTRA